MATSGPSTLAFETPLPSSDDSDLFYSFTDTDSPHITPTPLHSTLPPQDTPSQLPLPKTQLFVGADEEDDDDLQVTSTQSDDQSTLPQKSHDDEVVMTTEKE